MPKKVDRDHKAALRKLLAVLVSEWGYDEVIHSLEHVKKNGSRARYGSDTDSEAYALGKPKKAYVKPSAMDIVGKLDVSAARKSLLMELAEQFESRRFLPGIGDVRNFLEMKGKTSGGLSQRAEAFRRILNALLNTPDDRLEIMVRDTPHSGPSQLGPLSDAIKATRASVRSLAESRGPSDAGNEDRAAEAKETPPPNDDDGKMK